MGIVLSVMTVLVTALMTSRLSSTALNAGRHEFGQLYRVSGPPLRATSAEQCQKVSSRSMGNGRAVVVAMLSLLSRASVSGGAGVMVIHGSPSPIVLLRSCSSCSPFPGRSRIAMQNRNQPSQSPRCFGWMVVLVAVCQVSPTDRGSRPIVRFLPARTGRRRWRKLRPRRCRPARSG